MQVVVRCLGVLSSFLLALGFVTFLVTLLATGVSYDQLVAFFFLKLTVLLVSSGAGAFAVGLWIERVTDKRGRR